MKKLIVLVLLTFLFMLSGCSDAEIASSNLSRDADQFKIYRRVVFYNGITDQYILSVEGFCSIEIDEIDGQLELTVKIGDGKFYKHYLGLSDNVTYFVEQLDAANVSTSHYKVLFKPAAILPDIDLLK